MLILSAYAIDAPTDLRVTESSDTSIMLDWSDVTDSLGYYLYYGTETGVDGNYEVEWVDLIEESEFLLDSLSPSTQYFFAVTAVDEFVTESELSDEISFTTASDGEALQATSLRIDEVSVIDETSIEMIFTKAINTTPGAVREFILENKNTGDEISISVSEVDEENPTRIIAILDSALEENSQYELTILDIQDQNGGTIELWIDAFITFDTPAFTEDTVDMTAAEDNVNEETLSTDNNDINSDSQDDTSIDTNTDEDMNEATDENMNNSDNISQNSAGEMIEWNNAWQNIATSDLSWNTLVAAGQSDTLPQTGPEHWLLAFLALGLAGGIYYKNRR